MKSIVPFTFFFQLQKPLSNHQKRAFLNYLYLKTLSKGIVTFQLILAVTAFVRICRIQKALAPKGVDFLQIARKKSTSTFNNVLLTGALQIAIIETFASINLSPVAYLGHSFGEIICAYANNALDLEETVTLLFYFAWQSEHPDSQENGKVQFTKISYTLLN